MKNAFILLMFLLPFVVPNLLYNSDQTLPQCSDAVHSKYITIGPNGQSYATWHAQIDINNHCYHGHEHGSNPNLLWPNGPKPLYGYTMPGEAHNGFKTYVIDLDSTHRAMLTHHFGTGNAVNAVCNRFHTFDLIIIDSATGEKFADTHMHGDFGKPVANENVGQLITNPCVDKAIGSYGMRQFPIVASPYKNISYEPWRLHRDSNPNSNAFGFDSALITINTRNPNTSCDTITCTNVIVNMLNATGTLRTLEIPHNGFGFTGVVSGTFQVHGLQQYIKPGWSYRAAVIQRCWPIDPFSYAYHCRNVAMQDSAQFYRNFFITDSN